MFDSKLQKTLDNLLHPVTIDLDAEGRLTGWSGDITRYGLSISDASIAAGIDDFLPIVVGLDLTVGRTLPLVNLPGGHIADVIIQPDDSKTSTRIILLESRETLENIRSVQQKSHDTELLYQRLQELSDAIRKKNIDLEHALNARNQFISGVSHEFRTPITTIIGHCDLLAARFSDADPDIYQSLQAVDKNAKFLLALIDNLLEQGEISANCLSINPVQVDISNFFHFIVETFTVAAAEKQLKINYYETLDQAETLLLDEHYLYLILVNLITNALKFTDSGHIDITAKWENNTLSITISDTGIGIPSTALDKIFDPFSRAENVAGRRGSGLGLSIVKEVVTAMEGELDISSREGEGTSVTLLIPAPPQQTNQQPAKAFVESSAPIVMIVEDDADISALYKIMLNDAGMKPVCHTDGHRFVENIASTTPDIIVLDYNLGHENGLDLAKKARAANYKGPIILFTATSTITDHLEQRARKAGCTRLSQKPREVANLAEIISTELAGNDQ